MVNPNPNYRKNIKPGLTVPSGLSPELEKFLQAIKEHLQGADGARGQPTQRFVTLEDLEKIGLINTGVKNGRGVITKLNATTGSDSSNSSASVMSLSDLNDVTISTLQDGFILRFNSSLNSWVAEDPDDSADAGGYPQQLAWLGV